jgi:hypothetical protein
MTHDFRQVNYRVARWLAYFHTKNPNLDTFRGPWNGVLVYLMSIWNILRPFGKHSLCSFGIFFTAAAKQIWQPWLINGRLYVMPHIFFWRQYIRWLVSRCNSDSSETLRNRQDSWKNFYRNECFDFDIFCMKWNDFFDQEERGILFFETCWMFIGQKQGDQMSSSKNRPKWGPTDILPKAMQNFNRM